MYATTGSVFTAYQKHKSPGGVTGGCRRNTAFLLLLDGVSGGLAGAIGLALADILAGDPGYAVILDLVKLKTERTFQPELSVFDSLII